MFGVFAFTDGYGFNVKGGRDKPLREGDPCVYITRLRPGASAEKDGRLSPGDKIVEVCSIWLFIIVKLSWKLLLAQNKAKGTLWKITGAITLVKRSNL